MQLLGSPASPFVRKCRVVLIETGQDDVETVEVTASPMGGEARADAANPSGKIPSLLRPDGPAIYDSRVICRYLDQRARARGHRGLYPQGRIWEVLTLEAGADAVMDAAVGMTYERRFREGPGLVWQDWLDAQWAKVARSLDAWEARMMPLLHGSLTGAQIAVGCALGYLDLRHAERDWRAGREALASWERAFAARPAMAQTAPS
jgi:glutathione S-transferase